MEEAEPEEAEPEEAAVSRGSFSQCRRGEQPGPGPVCVVPALDKAGLCCYVTATVLGGFFPHWGYHGNA